MAASKRAEAKAAYEPPVIEDHGSLEALTADFDLDFIGSVAKVVTMAVVSGPPGGGGGGGGGGDAQPPGVSVTDFNPPADAGTPPTPDTVPGGGDAPPPGGVLGEEESVGGGGAGTLIDEPTSSGGETAGAPGAGVREEVAGGSGLPFTGYAAHAAAALGAAMTTSGVVLRSMLRRRDR